mmetsp:Transcript_21837/g.66968  ORF Transcript_21837/g.66968 Transcript_21837/m.66968 type:complete len:252 (-) Transcript_21837:674-1429(-)
MLVRFESLGKRMSLCCCFRRKGLCIRLVEDSPPGPPGAASAAPSGTKATGRWMGTKALGMPAGGLVGGSSARKSSLQGLALRRASKLVKLLLEIRLRSRVGLSAIRMLLLLALRGDLAPDSSCADGVARPEGIESDTVGDSWGMLFDSCCAEAAPASLPPKKKPLMDQSVVIAPLMFMFILGQAQKLLSWVVSPGVPGDVGLLLSSVVVAVVVELCWKELQLKKLLEPADSPPGFSASTARRGWFFRSPGP